MTNEQRHKDSHCHACPASRVDTPLFMIHLESRGERPFIPASCIMFRQAGLYRKIEIIKSDYAEGLESAQKLSNLALARLMLISA